MTVALTQKTWVAKKEEVQPDWRLIDADGEILGRIANKIAVILMGKDKPTYTPHVDTGDFVVVVNVEKIAVSGKKRKQKTYQSYSGWPSGQKERTFEEVLEKTPERILRLAVRRMLPKTRLGRAMLKKLKIYAGPDHPHVAQNPQPFKITHSQKEEFEARS